MKQVDTGNIEERRGIGTGSKQRREDQMDYIKESRKAAKHHRKKQNELLTKDHGTLTAHNPN